jgi:hypothetical protein
VWQRQQWLRRHRELRQLQRGRAAMHQWQLLRSAQLR